MIRHYRKGPGLLGELFLKAAAHQIAKPVDRRIGDRVEDLQTVLAAAEDAGRGQGDPAQVGARLSLGRDTHGEEDLAGGVAG